MELQTLTNHLQDLCSQAIEKKGEPVILIGAKDDELEDLSGY